MKLFVCVGKKLKWREEKFGWREYSLKNKMTQL